MAAVALLGIAPLQVALPVEVGPVSVTTALNRVPATISVNVARAVPRMNVYLRTTAFGTIQRGPSGAAPLVSVDRSRSVAIGCPISGVATSNVGMVCGMGSLTWPCSTCGSVWAPTVTSIPGVHTVLPNWLRSRITVPPFVSAVVCALIKNRACACKDACAERSFPIVGPAHSWHTLNWAFAILTRRLVHGPFAMLIYWPHPSHAAIQIRFAGIYTMTAMDPMLSGAVNYPAIGFPPSQVTPIPRRSVDLHAYRPTLHRCAVQQLHGSAGLLGFSEINRCPTLRTLCLAIPADCHTLHRDILTLEKHVNVLFTCLKRQISDEDVPCAILAVIPVISIISMIIAMVIPMSVPIITSVSGPVIVPVIAAVIDPMIASAPVIDPVIAPVITPVLGPMLGPVLGPVIISMIIPMVAASTSVGRLDQHYTWRWHWDLWGPLRWRIRNPRLLHEVVLGRLRWHRGGKPWVSHDRRRKANLPRGLIQIDWGPMLVHLLDGQQLRPHLLKASVANRGLHLLKFWAHGLRRTHGLCGTLGLVRGRGAGGLGTRWKRGPGSLRSCGLL